MHVLSIASTRSDHKKSMHCVHRVYVVIAGLVFELGILKFQMFTAMLHDLIGVRVHRNLYSPSYHRSSFLHS